MVKYLERIPCWHSIKKAESNKIVKSMHIWLILVPIIAKSMSLIESPFIIIISDKTYAFDVSLPFTWVLFFWAALSFTLANITFIFFAPTIIKDNDDLSDFERAGKDEGHLEKYFSRSLKLQWSAHLLKRGEVYGQYKSETNLKEWFWKAYEDQDVSVLKARVTCFSLYAVGFILITIVGLQNVWWVVQQINF